MRKPIRCGDCPDTTPYHTVEKKVELVNCTRYNRRRAAGAFCLENLGEPLPEPINAREPESCRT